MGNVVKKCTAPATAKSKTFPTAKTSGPWSLTTEPTGGDSYTGQELECTQSGLLSTSYRLDTLSIDLNSKGKLAREEMRALTCCLAGSAETFPALDQLYVSQRPQLTDRDKELVLGSWKKVKRKTQTIGAKAFLSLFAAYPDQGRYFDKFQNVFNEPIATSAVFLEHIDLVMLVVKKVIGHVHAGTDFGSLLYNLGDIHRKAGIPRMGMFLIVPFFVDSIRQEDKPWSDELEGAWRKFFQVICHVISEKLNP